MNSTAVPGNTFGLEIETPATDIVFGDGITDIVLDVDLINWIGTTGDIQSFEYDQIGLIDPATSSTPGTTFTFEIDEIDDTTPPTVILTTPDNGETGVSRDGVIQVTFSEEMSAILAGDLTISGSISGAIDTSADGVFTFNTSTNQSFTFAKTMSYAYLETVIVTVSGTVQDNSSNLNAMGTDYIFSFDIQSETPPTVLGTVPADGGIGVALGTTVGIIFSEGMDETTITDEANFSLMAAGATTEVAGAMAYNAGANTATFTPDEALTYSTEYTATVTTGMADEEGSPLAADYSFSFTTGAQIGEFSEAIVANNRITPGSSDPMQIFIETSTGSNATDVVTIQVYTATGRRVATLTTAGETCADVIARQPILWDGTNGRGQPLGPGLYFVQVSSAEYRRALRVLIVR